MESVLKAPPDSTNSDLICASHDVQDNDSVSGGRSNNSVSTSPSVAKSAPFRDPYLPEDDGSILTPEHAFVQYQTRSEDQACQICGQPAVGFHHRAYVCEACKKFFMRHTAARYRQAEAGGLNAADTICPMGGQCRVEGPGRGKCPHCRYRKCLDLGMTLTPPGGESGCDISQIPCRVCGGPSSGFHFGALTCEGCKGFFRRTVLSNVRLECLSNNDCPITPANRNMCKSCRFQRCLAVGMSKSGSRIGRQPNAIKYYCAREISQLSGSSATDFDGAQPCSSSSALPTGRLGQTNGSSRQRTTSASSESDKASSWSMGGDRSIQPAQSSTDHPGGSRTIAEPNGRFSSSSTPKFIAGGVHPRRPDISCVQSTTRRVPDPSHPPDSSPQSSGQRKRRPLDRCTGRFDIAESPTAIPFPCSVGETESDHMSYGSSPGIGIRDPVGHRMQALSPPRISRGLYGSFNQPMAEGISSDRLQHEYDSPVDTLSHGSLPLEYSLPDPDTSCLHISSSSPSITGLERGPVPSVDVSSRSPGKLLAPLSIPIALEDEVQPAAYQLLAVPSGELPQPQRRRDSRNTLPSPYAQFYQDTSAMHHYRITDEPPPQSYRTSATGLTSGDCPGPSSPVPSSNLSTTKPSRPTDPSLFVSRTTRSIVDHLTSTVLQFRNQQNRLRTTTAATGSKPDSPASVGSREYSSGQPKSTIPSMSEVSSSRNSASASHQLPSSSAQSPSLTHLSHGSYPSPSLLPHPAASSVTRIPTNHSGYRSSGSCKLDSPEVSWSSAKPSPLRHQQHQQPIYIPKPENRSPPIDSHFRSPPSGRFTHSPMNGTTTVTGSLTAVGADPGLSHVVDAASTSSASWFAAAAAAAAVANAIMVASQAAPMSHSSAIGAVDSDLYGRDRSLKLVNSRTELDPDYVGVDPGRRSMHPGSVNYQKRPKLGPGADSSQPSGRRSPGATITQVTESDLESIYGLRLAKCDPGVSGGSVLRSLQPTLSSSGSDMVTMRAAAAAAAAAAATAAGLVLSNSRVRADEFAHLHHRPVFCHAYPSSPSPTSPPGDSFARSLAAVTSAMDLALYGDRSDSSDRLPCAVVHTASASFTSPSPSVNLQATSTESSGPPSRSKNGVRTALISVQDFAEGINTAAKYMVTERKKIRNNLPQTCPPMHALERVEDVWDRMMQHFELHSRFIVHFVKLIPGFNHLELSDKRQLVRSAMYPLMLLELSRDYTSTGESRFNYFDFTEGELGVILKHFPTFHTITGHLIRSGEFLDQIRLDNIELTLVCAQEVFKNFNGLVDPASTEHLFRLAGRVLIDHILTSGKSLQGRSNLLRHVSPMLEELNMEHHQVIAQLRLDRPQLDFPELYTEMFQLSEDEEREHAM